MLVTLKHSVRSQNRVEVTRNNEDKGLTWLTNPKSLIDAQRVLPNVANPDKRDEYPPPKNANAARPVQGGGAAKKAKRRKLKPSGYRPRPCLLQVGRPAR